MPELKWLWPLLADGAAGITESLPPWASGTAMVTAVLGGPLFAIWYAWYTTTKTIPDERKAFVAQLDIAERRCDERFEAMEKRHAAHMEVRDRDSKEENKLAWDVNRLNSERTNVVLEKLVERIDKSCKFIQGQGQ